MEKKIYWLFYDTDITSPEDLQNIASSLQEKISDLVLFIPKSFDVKIMNKEDTLRSLQEMIDHINEKWANNE